jgi:hypothetical protein
VKELEDAGILRDDALSTALGELATELGVTEESLLSQIGQTEETLLQAACYDTRLALNTDH